MEKKRLNKYIRVREEEVSRRSVFKRWRMALISQLVLQRTAKLDHHNLTKGKEKPPLPYFIINNYIFVADISISPAILTHWEDVICLWPRLWSHQKLISATLFSQTNGAELHHVGQKNGNGFLGSWGGKDWLDNERWASLCEYLPLRVDVFLLPVVNDVLLLDDF